MCDIFFPNASRNERYPFVSSVVFTHRRAEQYGINFNINIYFSSANTKKYTSGKRQRHHNHHPATAYGILLVRCRFVMPSNGILNEWLNGTSFPGMALGLPCIRNWYQLAAVDSCVFFCFFIVSVFVARANRTETTWTRNEWDNKQKTAVTQKKKKTVEIRQRWMAPISRPIHSLILSLFMSSLPAGSLLWAYLNNETHST